MGKILEQKISAFFGGISDSTRKATGNEYATSRHFDVFTDPYKLIPYRSFESDTHDGSSATGMKQYYLRDFLYASTTKRLYALGQNPSAYPKLVYKADATTGNWTIPSNAEGNAAVRYGCLVEYKDYLWGFQGNSSVWRWGALSGSPTITNAAGTVGTVYNTVTGVAVNAGGTGYNINDILTVTNKNNSCKLIVTGVSGGVVTTVTILEPGFNQATGTGLATTVSPTGGTGCTINITSVGNVTTNITTVAQGLIGTDDNLYLPYNNILVRVYPSLTVQDQALKLPTNLKITSIANFGKYLAIGTAPKDGFNGVSKVFLWNFTSPDIQEVIDWGEGELRILETIEGMLVGVTDRYLNNDAGAGRGSLIIQGYTGGYPQVIKEIFTAKLTGQEMPLAKAVRNNRLFLAAKVFKNAAGTEYDEGIWSFGRKNAQYPWAISLDYIDENISTSGIQSFGSAANYFFIAHSGDGSVDKINDAATYTFTSIYEPNIINFNDTANDKVLKSVKIDVRRLTTGESVTLKYRADDETSWNTIGTFNTVGGISYIFTNASGSNFKSGKEYRFRVESTGGAEVTGLHFKAEYLNMPN
jgi:hypothetical protein